MGIRGTVRRSTDSWFVHCNVGEFIRRQNLLIYLLIFSLDTDVIIWEGDPVDPTRKPPEMYTLIENFCLGFRRLEVFGKLSSLRRGWVTALAPGQEEHLPANGSLQVEEEEGGPGCSVVTRILGRRHQTVGCELQRPSPLETTPTLVTPNQLSPCLRKLTVSGPNPLCVADREIINIIITTAMGRIISLHNNKPWPSAWAGPRVSVPAAEARTEAQIPALPTWPARR